MPNLEEALQQLENISSLDELENRFQSFLWKKWSITEALKTLWTLSPEEKKEKWWQLSSMKIKLQDAYQKKFDLLKTAEINKQLEKEVIDITLPWEKVQEWHYSLLSIVRRELEEIAHSMWFIVDSWNDAVSKFENFEAVNIPVSHPATEMHDTIYLSERDERWENYVLRTHTSAGQNYVIKKYWVPIKAVLPGRVYRFENMDATHDTMFYQFEWVYVDKNVSIWQFKSVINKFLSAALQKNVEIRMRPWYFPFVEPWYEIDTRYEYVNPKTWEKEMSDWMELLWAGMIHPNVLRNAWVDPDEWRTWFAFWMGISRLTAVRYWIKDIRYLTNWDLRFAKSW